MLNCNEVMVESYVSLRIKLGLELHISDYTLYKTRLLEVTGVTALLADRLIPATHTSFNCICQVMPMFTPTLAPPHSSFQTTTRDRFSHFHTSDVTFLTLCYVKVTVNLHSIIQPGSICCDHVCVCVCVCLSPSNCHIHVAT